MTFTPKRRNGCTHAGTAIAILVTTLVSGAVDGLAEPKLRVTTSIPPLILIAKRVGGNHVEVTSFMAANQDPHTFSPSPRQVAELQNCDLFLTVGVGFETVVVKKIHAMYPNLPIVNVADGLPSEGDHHGHDQHDHGQSHEDPHVWLSIPNLIGMAEEIRNALSLQNPQRKDQYADNYAALRSELQAEHARLTKDLAKHKGQVFFAYHPAFGAFAEDYGLIQTAVEYQGKDPSPKQLLRLVEQAREHDVSVILVEPQFPQRPAEIIAQRIGGRVVEANPLDPDPVTVLRQVAAALVSRGK